MDDVSFGKFAGKDRGKMKQLSKNNKEAGLFIEKNFDRLKREASFQDARVSKIKNLEIIKSDSPIKASYDNYDYYLNPTIEKIIGDVKNLSVLVYGCGTENAPFWFSLRGANCVAVDISAQSINMGKKIAKKNNLKVEFVLTNAENTSFTDESFDLIFGTAILHHLDTQKASKEMFRLLKPGGRAILGDNMAGNILVRFFRKLTPNLRTVDEHPLTKKDLEIYRNVFGNISLRFFCFIGQAYVFLARMVLGHYNKGIIKKISLLDMILLKIIPSLWRFYWICAIELHKSQTGEAMDERGKN